MQVGDIRRETPTICCSYGVEETGPKECKVVWVHTLRRFYTVRFANELGQSYCECYPFPPGERSPEPAVKRRALHRPSRLAGIKRGFR